jgi:hypothetical protein
MTDGFLFIYCLMLVSVGLYGLLVYGLVRRSRARSQARHTPAE